MPRITCINCQTKIILPLDELPSEASFKQDLTCPECQTIYEVSRTDNPQKPYVVMVKKTQPVPKEKLLSYENKKQSSPTINKIAFQALPRAKTEDFLPSRKGRVFAFIEGVGRNLRLGLSDLAHPKGLKVAGAVALIGFVLLGGYNILNRTTIMRADNYYNPDEKTAAVGWAKIQKTYESGLEYKFIVGMADKMMSAAGVSADNLSTVTYIGHIDNYSSATLTYVDAKRFGSQSLSHPLLMTFFGSFLQEWNGGPAWVDKQIANLADDPNQVLVAATDYKDVHITLQIDKSLGIVTCNFQKQ